MEEKGVSRSMGDELKLGEAREVRAVEGCGRSYSGELSGVSGGEWHCHCAVDCLNAAACRGESGCGMTLVIDARATEAAVRGDTSLQRQGNIDTEDNNGSSISSNARD